MVPLFDRCLSSSPTEASLNNLLSSSELPWVPTDITVDVGDGHDQASVVKISTKFSSKILSQLT